jgi:hypothetical protein
MVWGHASVATTPATMFWTTLLLGVLLGALGVTQLRGARPRTIGVVVLMLAVITPVVARALPPALNTFTNGMVADATQVNANFATVNIATPGNQSASNGFTGCSAGPTVYCGSTTTASPGGLGGYTGARSMCQSVCPLPPTNPPTSGFSATAHMCMAEELIRTAQLGQSPAAGNGWYSTGSTVVLPTNPPTGPTADCGGWTQGGFGFAGMNWAGGNPQAVTCGTALPVLCCD